MRPRDYKAFCAMISTIGDELIPLFLFRQHDIACESEFSTERLPCEQP